MPETKTISTGSTPKASPLKTSPAEVLIPKVTPSKSMPSETMSNLFNDPFEEDDDSLFNTIKAADVKSENLKSTDMKPTEVDAVDVKTPDSRPADVKPATNKRSVLSRMPAGLDKINFSRPPPSFRKSLPANIGPLVKPDDVPSSHSPPKSAELGLKPPGLLKTTQSSPTVSPSHTQRDTDANSDMLPQLTKNRAKLPKRRAPSRAFRLAVASRIGDDDKNELDEEKSSDVQPGASDLSDSTLIAQDQKRRNVKSDMTAKDDWDSGDGSNRAPNIARASPEVYPEELKKEKGPLAVVKKFSPVVTSQVKAPVEVTKSPVSSSIKNKKQKEKQDPLEVKQPTLPDSTTQIEEPKQEQVSTEIMITSPPVDNPKTSPYKAQDSKPQTAASILLFDEDEDSLFNTIDSLSKVGTKSLVISPGVLKTVDDKKKSSDLLKLSEDSPRTVSSTSTISKGVSFISDSPPDDPLSIPTSLSAAPGLKTSKKVKPASPPVRVEQTVKKEGNDPLFVAQGKTLKTHEKQKPEAKTQTSKPEQKTKGTTSELNSDIFDEQSSLQPKPLNIPVVETKPLILQPPADPLLFPDQPPDDMGPEPIVKKEKALQSLFDDDSDEDDFIAKNTSLKANLIKNRQDPPLPVIDIGTPPALVTGSSKRSSRSAKAEENKMSKASGTGTKANPLSLFEDDDDDDDLFGSKR